MCVSFTSVAAMAAPPVLPVTGPAKPVPGWTDYCRRNPNACSSDIVPDQILTYDAGLLGLLERVDRQVNHGIEQITDRVHWGVEDRWDLPTDGKGDCEDLAILKRKLLMDAGLPRSALPLLIGWTPDDEGHTVLLVRTDRGDLVLDDRNDDILSWCETPYRFVERQSNTSESEWVSVFGEKKPADCRIERTKRP